MVVVFDLDDTLYDELTFVFGGFRAVANFLSQNLDLSVEYIEAGLKEELLVKRKEVFDRFLIKQHAFNKKLVATCLSIYRSHKPHLKLYPDAEECLKGLKGNSLYVVTDGNKIVQKSKFIALGLDKLMRKCVCTNAYGIKYAKPSPYCFMKICEWEKVSPSEVVYIADNPYKDFVGIKPLGFKTIRLLRGPYKNLILPGDFEADHKIKSLLECLPLLT